MIMSDWVGTTSSYKKEKGQAVIGKNERLVSKKIQWFLFRAPRMASGTLLIVF